MQFNTGLRHFHRIVMRRPLVRIPGVRVFSRPVASRVWYDRLTVSYRDLTEVCVILFVITESQICSDCISSQGGEFVIGRVPCGADQTIGPKSNFGCTDQ